MTLFRLFTFIFFATLFIGCGSGGGGGGESDPSLPAIVDVDAEPATIDTGDRLVATIYLFDVNDDGIMLKIKTPIGLTYVTDSGLLTVDSQTFDVSPTFNKTDAAAGYLVYFLPRRYFGEDNRGVLRITYTGTAAVTTGTIDVDPDLDNPDVSNSAEFSVESPNFSAEASKAIVVTG